jgi:hypothetical protein
MSHKGLLEQLEGTAPRSERLCSAVERVEALQRKVQPFVKPLRPAATSTAGLWQRETPDTKPARK